MERTELQARMDLMALLVHQEKTELPAKTDSVSLVELGNKERLEPLAKMVL